MKRRTKATEQWMLAGLKLQNIWRNSMFLLASLIFCKHSAPTALVVCSRAIELAFIYTSRKHWVKHSICHPLHRCTEAFWVSTDFLLFLLTGQYRIICFQTVREWKKKPQSDLNERIGGLFSKPASSVSKGVSAVLHQWFEELIQFRQIFKNYVKRCEKGNWKCYLLLNLQRDLF